MSMNRERAFSGEMDLREVILSLRRAAILILLTALPVAVLAYVVTGRQPTLYASTAAIMTVDGPGSRSPGTVVYDTLTSAPTLPPGALAGALRGEGVVGDIVRRLGRTPLDAPLVRAITADLRGELVDGRFERLTLKAPADAEPNGVYELRAQAETPAAARALASAAASALLAWDRARAQRDVDQAQLILRRQVQDLSRLLVATAPGSPEALRLRQARAEVWQALTRVDSLDAVVSGTLAVVTPPVAPRQPVSPRPLRNALLAGLLTALLTGGLTLLGQLWRPVVYGPGDVAALGVPVLGQLPRLRGSHGHGDFLRACRSASWARAAGFLCLNLRSAHRRGRFVVSGAAPGVGTSSVTAGLADALGRRGDRVLVVEVEFDHPAQLALWAPAGQEWVPLAETAEGHGARALRVAPNVDLLPGAELAGELRRRGPQPASLDRPDLGALLDVWGEGYDVVLVDAPPLASLPETAALAAGGDGVLLVLETGRTRLEAVKEAVQTAALAGAPLLGLVLNGRGVARRARVPAPSPTRPPAAHPGRNAVDVKVADAD